MSAPRSRVTFAADAWDDYQQLLLYSLGEWGEAQAVAYEAAFDRAFSALGEHPALGRARDDLRPGYRGYPVGQHIIYYTVRRQTVRIIRILHRRRDARRALA